MAPQDEGKSQENNSGMAAAHASQMMEGEEGP